MSQQELPDELYLPVLFRAPGIGKKIAVTVDGCDHIGNLRRIIRIFDRYGADLTLFSIGRTFAAQETVSQTCAQLPDPAWLPGRRSMVLLRN